MPVPLTMEQIKEEQRMEMEQVDAALNWLKSTDSKQRIVGAEQLGAYPTAEAEKALAFALGKDANPEVRVAAATSLANFQEPGTAAIHGLLSVLRDKSEDVRHAALGTLDIYLETLDSDSARHRQIIAALGKLAKSPNVDPATRETLSDLLSSR
ncbi:MAG: HEAT repeat domain-containing protein [Methylococcaceae bacterium]|nr:HEAT repeat domain-containing protein [Methylococcaceae bacterium]